jgi:uncharacterized protein
VFDCPDYVPSRRWSGGHRMTIYTWARRRRFPALPAPVLREFDVAKNARVRADCYWQRERRNRGTVLALHGLEASSSAHYMRGLADKAFARGYNVVLLNQRNCGGTEALSQGLYHSGLSTDPAAVIQELVARDGLRAIGVVGYSLGGNLSVKLAGDFGHERPPELKAICAVSPTLDLAACVRALERRSNFAYQLNFVRNLRGRMRRKAAAWPGRYDLAPLGRVWSVRGFDEAYTAPHHGFADAADYYHRASALRVADRIRVPTLILSADNDPFVPPEQFRRPEITSNPLITVVITRDGGHCGFVAESADGYDGYWAEHVAIAFLSQHVEA